MVVLLAITSAGSAAQVDSQSGQQVVDQLRRQQQLLEMEADRAKAELDDLRQMQERRRAERDLRMAREAFDELQAERGAEAKKAAKEAEDRIDDAREELHMAAVHSADALYLAASIALPLIFGALIARMARKEGGLRYEQKFGVSLMVLALLMAIVAMTVSEGWVPRFDTLQNIMQSLRIRLIEGERHGDYYLDLATKHVLAWVAVVAAYGFTTYLGITPAYNRRRSHEGASSQPSSEA